MSRRSCCLQGWFYRRERYQLDRCVTASECSFVGDPGRPRRSISKMRAALDGTNISQAYFLNAANGPTGTGGNLMLGCDGAAISEELTLHEVDGILPINGIITHTNHILSPRLQHIPDYFRTKWEAPSWRLCRADELLKGKKNIDQSIYAASFQITLVTRLGYVRIRLQTSRTGCSTAQTILLFLIIQKESVFLCREPLRRRI